MELRWANLQDHEAGPEFREVHWIWKLEFNRLFECKSWARYGLARWNSLIDLKFAFNANWC